MSALQSAEVNGMRIEVTPTYEQMSERLAQVYIGRVAVKSNLLTMVPTGTTPPGWYRKLIEHAEANPGYFGEVVFYNLDEFCVVDEGGCRMLNPNDPRSYRFYMSDRVEAIGVKDSHFPSEKDFYAPGSYDAKIAAAGGIDFAVHGIGPDHAFGFNFAGSPLDSVTRHVELTTKTRDTNARLTEINVDEMPTDALTAGIGTVMQARELWTIAKGENKAQVVYDAVHDPINSNNPATFTRLHKNHTLLIDEAAASLLDI